MKIKKLKNTVISLVTLFSGVLSANNLIGIIDQDPTAVDYYNQALGENNYGNTAAAIEKINKALAIKPDYANALSYRGYFYELVKEYDKALVDYLAADKLKPNVNGVQVAATYAKMGNKAEAFKWLEKTLSNEFNRPDLNYVITNADFESLKADTKWKEITTKNWHTPYEKLLIEAKAKTAANDPKGALNEINKAIQLDASKDAGFNARGIYYIYQGDFKKALLDINEAIRLKEKSEYYGNRAYIYKQLEKYKEAMTDYEKAVQLDPENIIEGDRALVRFKLNSKDSGIEQDLKKYLSIYYKDDFNWYFLGIYYYNTEKNADALEVLSKAISIKNDVPDYYTKRSDVLFALKLFDKAIADCTKAIALDPSNAKAYYTRGVIYGEQMKKQYACNDFKKAKDLGYYDENGYYEKICK